MRSIVGIAVWVLLAAATFGCGGDDEVGDVELEGRVASLEESVASLSSKDAETEGEISDNRERLDDLEGRVEGLEEVASKEEFEFPDKGEWSESKEKGVSSGEGAVEWTARALEESGLEVRYVEHAGRGDRTVLVAPSEFVDGETPLIVSLHGFGGNSYFQSAFVPLHERVNSRGFGLLLPNGSPDAEGSQFWNPTDECCEGGKSGLDDVAYLTELVAEAKKVKNFGAVYIFGYSNGGFMAHHMACKGLPGLRAVASLSGTSYVEESGCDGAAPVSALQVHGTEDEVIRYGGDRSESEVEGSFYVGAEEMAARWGRLAGCDWQEGGQPYATFDFDGDVSGAETEAYRVDSDSGCAEGIVVELWKGMGSNHGPEYGDAFVDALLDWLLAQR